jgi:hypothetical protein
MKTISLWSVVSMLALAALAGQALGEHRTWVGPDEGDWFDPGNWDPYGEPDPTDQLAIYEGTAATYWNRQIFVSGGGSILLDGPSACLWPAVELIASAPDGREVLTVRNGARLETGQGLVLGIERVYGANH